MTEVAVVPAAGGGPVDEEVADFEDAAPCAEESDGSSDSDGLPPLDPYWSSFLNVSKVGAPLAPLKPPKDGERASGKGGAGGKGAGYGKGRKGSAANKGGKAKSRGDNIGAFVAWAKDPNTEDGSRPPIGTDDASRSRSPRRQRGSTTEHRGGSGPVPAGTAPAIDGRRLEDFLSWAQDRSEAKEEPQSDDEEDETVAGGINNFMAWATRGPSPKKEEAKDEKFERRYDNGDDGDLRTKTEDRFDDDGPLVDVAAKDEAEIPGARHRLRAGVKRLAGGSPRRRVKEDDRCEQRGAADDILDALRHRRGEHDDSE